MWQFGHLPSDNAHWEDSPWKPILLHPDGPSEFPVDQILTLRWFEEENCPVPGTKFPQLAGHQVKKWPCVEHGCDRSFFSFDDDGEGPPKLAEHLRIMHRWGVQDVIALGDRLGVNFDQLYRGMGQPVDIDLAATPEVTYNCPDCDWRPKPDAKKPDIALQAHARAVHPPLVVEVASS